MADTTLILHGWSDCSESFEGLKTFLVEEGVGDVETIYYADYESREDAITYEDVVGGLHDELRERGLVDGEGHGSFDVVVHSTGGLVIRHWIWRYYGDRIAECPVENLVMLAPANFGSPLAHRGKSLLGRAFKGRWKVGDLWEVGRNLLSGLELGSAYQWELAHRDLLGPEPFYDADRIRLTILVGTDDYEGLRGWVNKRIRERNLADLPEAIGKPLPAFDSWVTPTGVAIPPSHTAPDPAPGSATVQLSPPP